MARKKNSDPLYNEEVKKRFLKQTGWCETFVSYIWNVFVRSARLENSLQKDIYEFTAQESSDLLYLLQLKSSGHVMQIVSIFAGYVSWAYKMNLSNNPVNYFETFFNRDNAPKYVSIIAIESRYITEEQLFDYEKQLTSIGNYVDAALLRGCFLGLRGSKFKELLTLTIDMVKPKEIILENRNIPITDYEYNLINGAYNQPELVSLKGETKSNFKPVYLKCEYVFKAVNKHQHMGYTSFSMKIAAVGEYVQHINLIPTNLYFSGMINALNKMMIQDNVEPLTVFCGRSTKYFEVLKEQFGFEGEHRYLKYKLQEYFIGV